MARRAPEYLWGEIMCGYLGTTASLALWNPDEMGIELFQMDEGNVEKRPCVVICTNEDKASKTAGKRVIMATALLRFSLIPQGEDAATDEESLRGKMTREQGAEMLEALESRLRDRSALAAYLASLDEDKRSGWRLMKYHPMTGGEIVRDQKTADIDLGATVKVVLAWSENNE